MLIYDDKVERTRRPVMALFILITTLCGCKLSDNSVRGGFPSPSISIEYFKINSGTGYTNDLNITLEFAYPSATMMSIHTSLDDCLVNTNWEPFAPTKPDVLSQRNNAYTMAVKFKTEENETSDCYTASITHDDFRPTMPSDLKLSTSGPSLSSINLYWSPATDTIGIDHYEVEIRVSSDDSIIKPWTPFTNGNALSSAVSSLEPDVAHYVVVRAVDKAGNRSIELVGPQFSSQSTQHRMLESFSPQGFSQHEVIDFDGDGDLDIISIGTHVLFFENNGDQSFTAHTIADYPAIDVGVADFNGDGILDIAVSSRSSVAWFESSGTGEYSFHLIDDTTAFGPMVIFDSNGNGRPDIVTGYNGLYHFINTEEGFVKQQILSDLLPPPFNIWPRDIKTGDINGNGLEDIVVTSWTSSVFIYTNNGDTTFTEIWLASEWGVQGVDLKDLDQDGDLDISISAKAIWPFSDYSLAWYSNDGVGNFTRQIITGVLDETQHVDNHIVDLDSDGNMDLIGLHSDGFISWSRNNGAESFTTTPLITDLLVHQWDHADFNEISSGDLDNDGDMDIIVSTRKESLFWLENDGTEVFTRRNLSDKATPSLSVGGYSAALDVDGDGDLDFVSADYFNNAIHLHLNDGNNNFTTTTLEALVPFNTGAQFIEVGDMNSDGLPDLVVQYYDRKMAWWRNDGGGSFTKVDIGTQGVTDNLSNYIERFTMADVDGDGDLDILSGVERFNGSSNGLISLWRNDGLGNFTRTTVATSAQATEYRNFSRMQDLDGDGTPDFAVIRADGSLYWFSNDGSGAFTGLLVDNTLTDTAYDIEILDVDGDGAKDLLVTYNNFVHWYKNDGSQAFTLQAPIMVDNCRFLSTGDLNNDGLLDAVCVAKHNGSISVLENTGDGSFKFHPISRRSGDIYSAGGTNVVLHDMDNDGFLNIISKMSWFKLFF